MCWWMVTVVVGGEEQNLAAQILAKSDHNHDAVLSFDEFIPWSPPFTYTCAPPIPVRH